MRHRSLLAAVAAAALLLTACGGPDIPPEAAEAQEIMDQILGQAGIDPDDASDVAEMGEASGAGTSSNGGVGDTDAAVVVTIDGVDFGYRHGSCWIDENVVQVQAVNDNPMPLMDQVSLVWYPPLGHLPYALQQTVNITVSNTAAAAPAPFELFASWQPMTPDATWSVTVDGTTVEMTGTLTHDTRNSTVEPRAEDVTITADCSQQVFGDGPMLGTAPVSGEMSIVFDQILGNYFDGQIDVDFQGVTHSIDAMTTCNTIGGDVSLQGISNDLQIYAYQGSVHEVQLDLGDSRLRDDRITYQLPDGADVTFAVDGSTQSWSGTVVGPNGEEEPISITATCPEQ